MDFAVCMVPAAAVRKKASHKSEMSNQLLFGEMMEVLRTKKGEWLLVRSVHDKYEGYIRSNLVAPVDAEDVNHESHVIMDKVHHVNIYDHEMLITAGCTLPAFNGKEGTISATPYSFNGTFNKCSDLRPGADNVITLTRQWLYAPYLWGGRTPLGVDCSGFVQVIYKLMGILLWRDAYLQVEQGIRIQNLADAQCGDLAFFADKKKRIMHVGILLNDHEIIHASGNVRIDHIDEQGITHTETGKRTHTLQQLRRYW